MPAASHEDSENSAVFVFPGGGEAQGRSGGAGTGSSGDTFGILRRSVAASSSGRGGNDSGGGSGFGLGSEERIRVRVLAPLRFCDLGLFGVFPRGCLIWAGNVFPNLLYPYGTLSRWILWIFLWV